MQLLLDTHIALWALEDSPRLPERARKLILDPRNQIFISSASIWEIQIKHDAHPDRMAIDGKRFRDLCHIAGYELLSINTEHVVRLPELARKENAKPHNDPFDRILICQAAEENMRLVTHDALIGDYTEPSVLLV